jgi:hypothetical protein
LLLEKEQHFNNGKKVWNFLLTPILIIYCARATILMDHSPPYACLYRVPENKMQYSYVPDFYTAIIITERRKFNLRDAFWH